jgi:hypothetical protein
MQGRQRKAPSEWTRKEARLLAKIARYVAHKPGLAVAIEVAIESVTEAALDGVIEAIH